MLDTFKKIGIMFALLFMLVGLVWSIVALASRGEWWAIIGEVLLALAATPKVIELAKMLIPYSGK